MATTAAGTTTGPITMPGTIMAATTAVTTMTERVMTRVTTTVAVAVTGAGAGAGGADGSPTTVSRLEISAGGLEVTYGDGSREEIENGRYERKDAAGRTVEQRPATAADVERLQALR